ncbi:uncharacterized protein ACRADG_010226 [Cochliomyia hominivorax]
MFTIKIIYHKLSQYYLIFTGATSYLYNHNTNTYRQTYLTRLIAGLSNIYCFLLLCYVYYLSAIMFEPTPNVHPLLKSMTRISLLIHTMATFYTVLHRKWRETKEIPLNIQLNKIKIKYFTKYEHNQQIDKQFRILYNIKYILLFYIYCTTFTFSKRFSFTSNKLGVIFLTIHNANILNVLYIIMFKFYEISLNICCLLFYLNYQLDNVYQKLEEPIINHKQLHEEIRIITKIHGELSTLLHKYFCLYKFQLITNRIFCSTNNVIMMYYGYIFIFYYPTKILYIVFGGISYLVLTVDLYLNDFIYEMIGKSFEQLILISQEFNLKQLLYREFEEFSIYFCCRKELLCGFKMNLAAWFKLMTQLLAGAIVLIQSHLTILNTFRKYNLEIY